MNIETQEINGFQIDIFNQHKLEEGKPQGICPLCSADRKGEHKKANAQAMIGSEELELAIIVTKHFKCTLIKEKESQKKYMLNRKT